MSSLVLILAAVFYIVLIGGLVAYLVYAAYQLYFFKTAPYVPSKPEVMEQMIAMANIRPGMHVLELGSGNGELCILAAKSGAIARGIEGNPFLVEWANRRAQTRGVAGTARFEKQNFWTMTFPRDTDLVFVYLLPDTMKKLLPKLRAELRRGTVVISNTFEFPDVVPERVDGVVRKYVL